MLPKDMPAVAKFTFLTGSVVAIFNLSAGQVALLLTTADCTLRR